MHLMMIKVIFFTMIQVVAMEMEIDSRPRNFVRLLVDVLDQEWPPKKGQDLKAHWSTYATFQVILELEVKKIMAGFMILRNPNVKLSYILELVEMLYQYPSSGP